MRILTLIFSLILSFTVLSQPISFNDAWQRLQRESNKLKAQNQEVNRAQAEQEAVSDLNLPSLSLAGSYTHLEQPFEMDISRLKSAAGAILPPTIGSRIPSSIPFTEQDVFRASLKALWPIYTGGKITAAQSIKAAQVVEKKQSLELAKRELFSQLVNRYFSVILTENVVQTQNQVVAALEKHLHHAKKLEKHGQIARVEKLNAEVALSNARVKLGNVTRQHQMAQIALDRMLSGYDLTPNTPIFMLSDAPSLPQLNELTLEHHPALSLLQAKEAQAQGLMSMEKGKYLPKVFLYGNYTLYEDKSSFSKIEPDWLVGVGVNVPIFSNDGRSGKVAAARSALMQARYMKAQTKQDLSLLVDQTYRQLAQSKEEIKGLNSSLVLAKENVRLRELAFNQGMSTSIDLVDAELKLSAVKTQELLAKYHYIQAYGGLMIVSGQLNEFLASAASAEKHNAS